MQVSQFFYLQMATLRELTPLMKFFFEYLKKTDENAQFKKNKKSVLTTQKTEEKVSIRLYQIVKYENEKKF